MQQPDRSPPVPSEEHANSEAAPALEDLPQPGPEDSSPLIGASPAVRDPVPDLEGTPAPASGTEAGTPSSETIRVSMDDLDELTIVARAQDGDPQAFDWLITAYQGGIYRLCFRMLNDRTEAEDVLQETFISAWRSLPNLTAPQAFIPWLYQTATNKCLDELRRRSRRPRDRTAGSEATEPGASQGSSDLSSPARDTIGGRTPQDPAQEVENQAQMQALAGLLQTIPPGLRTCWLLRSFHEFSYSEIAAIVRLPESTVRGRIARARQLLAEGMAPWR